MKKIILQHWTGELNELGERSSQNIANYAKQVNADYQLLRGNVFDNDLTPPMQKLFMLDPSFDDYDIVVMLDMDVFVRKGQTVDIFEDEVGIGRHTPVQDNLQRQLCRIYPHLGDKTAPYWGGSIYRLPLELRQNLRDHYNKEEIMPFSKPYHFEDEGVMHRMASKAGIKISPDVFLDKFWNYSSFEHDIEKAKLIHIRTKITPKGPKQEKIQNYRALVSKGLIEE